MHANEARTEFGNLTRDKSAPACTLEHETQAAFLKALIAYEDGEVSRQLRDNLVKAERERKFVRRAISLMVMLFLLSLAGLGYCALLLPQIFCKPTHFVITSLCILGLASQISQLEFCVYLVWHRFAEDRFPPRMPPPSPASARISDHGFPELNPAVHLAIARPLGLAFCRHNRGPAASGLLTRHSVFHY